MKQQLLNHSGRKVRKSLWFLIGSPFAVTALLILWSHYVPPLQSFGINLRATNEMHLEKLRREKLPVGGTFRFIAFGDNRAGTLFTNHALKGILEAMRKEKDISFAVNTGDLSFDSREKDYAEYKRLMDMVPFPVLDVLGNHDVFHDGRLHFARYCGSSDFTLAYGPAYFVFYDNASGKFDEDQMAWLKEKLKEAEAYPQQIVVTHRPPFNPHFDPSKPLDFANFRDHTGWWDFGESFQKIYEWHKVDLVVAGHFHYFDAQSINDVQYLTTGGGGIIITEGKGGFLHYLVITVGPDQIRYELKIVKPPLWESLVYYFWKDIYYSIQSYLDKNTPRSTSESLK